MKVLALAIALAVFGASPAAAQQQQTMPPMNAAQMQQLRQMHEQFRAQVLGYLTPEHKALLAQVAGQLAVSTNPDYDSAAAQLDAALSPAEKTNIANAAAAMETKMKSMMPSMPEHHLTPGGVLLMVAVGHAGAMMMHP